MIQKLNCTVPLNVIIMKQRKPKMKMKISVNSGQFKKVWQHIKRVWLAFSYLEENNFFTIIKELFKFKIDLKIH